MRNERVIVSIVAVGLLIPFPVAAHHGSAAFDTGKKVTLKGTVKEWVYSNPHCLLSLDVTGENGQPVTWIAEGQAPNVIFPVGYRKDSFKAGDQVTVTVEPVKNGRSMGRILQAVLADGRTLGPAASPPASTSAPPQPQ
jgi:hypothetical protein